MGSVNLLAIENTVRLQGDYQRSAKFTQAYVHGAIQAGWSELYELIADTWEGWWDKTGNVTTVASQSYIALPTDCWRVLGVDIADGTGWTELDQVTIADRNRFGSSLGQPAAFRLSSRGLELYQTPGAAYSLRITYTPIVTPLSSSTAIQFYNDWQEFVIESALLRLHTREGRGTQETWAKLYDPANGLKTRITRAASKRKASGPQYLNLHEGRGTYEEPV